MGFRFRRSVKILPGVRLNFGKKGTSVSVGPRGAKVTVGPSGTRATVGIPGTGISYTEKLDTPKEKISATSGAAGGSYGVNADSVPYWKHCPHCGRGMRRVWEQCPECGGNLPALRRCPRCGNVCGAELCNYCFQCGEKLNEEPSPLPDLSEAKEEDIQKYKLWKCECGMLCPPGIKFCPHCGKEHEEGNAACGCLFLFLIAAMVYMMF